MSWPYPLEHDAVVSFESPFTHHECPPSDTIPPVQCAGMLFEEEKRLQDQVCLHERLDALRTRELPVLEGPSSDDVAVASPPPPLLPLTAAQTPAHQFASACLNGEEAAAAALLRGAPEILKGAVWEGLTALHVAALGGCVDVVRHIIHVDPSAILKKTPVQGLKTRL
jgi:hypothetical protein